MADELAGKTGWKHNPLVGCVAVVAVVLSVASIVARIPRVRPPRQKISLPITLACPECDTTYAVNRQQAGCTPADDPQAFRDKAVSVPCPKCGQAKSVVAFFCRRCGQPFAPPASGAAAEPSDFRCPHCGESPWRSPPPPPATPQGAAPATTP